MLQVLAIEGAAAIFVGGAAPRRNHRVWDSFALHDSDIGGGVGSAGDSTPRVEAWRWFAPEIPVQLIHDRVWPRFHYRRTFGTGEDA